MKSSNARALVGVGLLTGSFRAMLSSALTIAALTTITSVVAMSSAHAVTQVVDQSTFNADTTNRTTSYFDSYGVTGSNFMAPPRVSRLAQALLLEPPVAALKMLISMARATPRRAAMSSSPMLTRAAPLPAYSN
jgi:hypothetical protein